MALHHFPLEIANSFIPGKMAMLSGDIDGTMQMSGNASQPLPVQLHRQDDVLIHIQDRNKVIVLEDKADVAAAGRW